MSSLRQVRMFTKAFALLAAAAGPAAAQGSDSGARIGEGARADTNMAEGWWVLRPSISLTWRDGVPDARGDGPAETAPGLTVRIRGGLAWQRGGFSLRVAPEITKTYGTAFPTFPSGDPARHPASSPFYVGAHSADLPSFASSEPSLWPGESGAWYTRGPITVAVTSAQADWGPGAGEGLVLGRSGPGVPRAELGWAWGAGPSRAVTLRWFAGRVRESDRFDADAGNDWRTLSGLRVEFAHERAISWRLGASRTVMDGRRGHGFLGSAFSPFALQRTDSLLELLAADARLSSPASGTDAWLELVRQSPLGTLREFLESPTERLAFRFGIAQRLHESARARWTGTLEFVLLDQPQQQVGVVPNDLYTSATVAQGWTHHGQPLGSGLGPGGQRQFARLERAGATWTLGAFAERARWNDGVMLRLPDAASDRHDVTVQTGLEASRALLGYRVAATLSGGKRMNYLFQGSSVMPNERAVDIGVLQLGLTLAPLR